MDIAISLLRPGKQEEVNAESFKGQNNYKRGTFICPECGEDVNLRMSNKQKNYFAHFKNEITTECDLRTVGLRSLTVYERLGVPLYLTKSQQGYALNVGFKSISRIALKTAEDNKAYLELRFSKKDFKRINIDSFNFIPDNLNLFKINNYPSFNQKFSIRYSNLPTTINKWAEFIDPITESGILFSINSNIGKSIRHGDTIYSDEEYIWISPKKLNGNRLHEKNIVFEDHIELNDRKHFIYRVTFIKNQKDIQSFSKISELLHKELKVILLDSQNNINIIWPPSIKTEEGYSVSAKGRIHSSVQSVNENPNIYIYSSNNFTIPIKVKSNYYNKRNYLNFNLVDSDVQLNMDRQISSTGMDIKYEDVLYEGKGHSIKDNVDMSLKLDGINKVEALDLELFTGIKTNTIRINKNKRVEVRRFMTGHIKWENLTYGDIIYLLNNDNIISQINIEKDEKDYNYSLKNIAIISQLPQKHNHLTAKNRKGIYKMIKNDKRYAAIFEKTLQSNTIPYLIQKILQEVDENDRI